jgi:hypothetical protein
LARMGLFEHRSRERHRPYRSRLFPVHKRFFLFSNLRVTDGRNGKNSAALDRLSAIALMAGAARISGVGSDQLPPFCKELCSQSPYRRRHGRKRPRDGSALSRWPGANP